VRQSWQSFFPWVRLCAGRLFERNIGMLVRMKSNIVAPQLRGNRIA
jgi:hypothetical protein